MNFSSLNSQLCHITNQKTQSSPFGKLEIPAPVVALKIEVKRFDAFTGDNESLLPRVVIGQVYRE